MAHMFLPAANGQPGLVITRVVALEYTSSLSDRYQFFFCRLGAQSFYKSYPILKGIGIVDTCGYHGLLIYFIMLILLLGILYFGVSVLLYLQIM